MDGIYEPNDINEIKGLPDDFHYEYYRKLSKETDLSRWAFEFARRQEGIDKDKLLVDTGGITYKTGVDDIKTIWRNGVYIGGNLNTHDCKYYLDEINNQYLKKAKAVFVPDGEENNYKDKIKVCKTHSTISTPESEHYKRWHSKLGKTYFSTYDICMEHYRKSSRLYNITATFLINLEMPTAKLINELKERIKTLKESKNIQEKNTKYNKWDTWAMGLASFDLQKGGVKREVIIKKYLSYCYDGSQINDDVILTTSDENRWNDAYNPVCKMINGDWKSLTGNPE